AHAPPRWRTDAISTTSRPRIVVTAPDGTPPPLRPSPEPRRSGPEKTPPIPSRRERRLPRGQPGVAGRSLLLAMLHNVDGRHDPDRIAEGVRLAPPLFGQRT